MYMVRFRRTLLKRILLNCTCKKATEKEKEKDTDKEYESFKPRNCIVKKD
jgi:hypothetical protein